MKFSWFNSLRFRVLAASVTGLLVLFALVIINTNKVLDEFAVENTRTLIKQTSETLNLVVVPQTTDEGLNELDPYLNELVHDNESGLIYLVIHDEQDRILASSQNAPDPLPDAAAELEQQLDTGNVHINQPILLADNRIGHLHYGLSTRPLQQTNSRLVRENLLLLGSGLMFVFIMLIATGRRVGSQLGYLVSASQRLADGDYKSRAVVSGNHEFSYLAHNFNLMAEAVAERKNLESELRQSNQRFRAMFEESQDGIIVADVESKKVIDANATMCAMTGYDMDELLLLHISDIHPKADLPHVIEQFEKQARGEIIVAEDIPVLRKDGSIFSADISVSHLEFEGRAHMAGFFRDITERKQAEHDLEVYRLHLEELVAEREATVRQQARIIDQSHDSIVTTDLDGRISSWNSGAEKLFGIQTEDAIGKHISMVYPPEEHDFLQHEVIQPLQQKGQHEVEVRMWRADHSVFDAQLFLSILHDENGKPVGMIGYSMDITERKKIESALRESETNLAHAQAIAHVGSWHMDIIKDQLKWSEETYRIFEQEITVPASLEHFVNSIHPEDRDNVLHAWAGAQHGTPYDIEHRIVVNGTEKWVREQAEVQFDINGRAVAALGTVQDISEQKAIENALGEAKRKAEELTQVKSEFLANMSHEIRTPLNAVLGFAKMGLRDNENNETSSRFNHILDSGQHLLGIINDILDLSKIDAGKLCLEDRPFRLTSTVEDALDLITEQARVKNVAFSINLEPDLPTWVMGDSLRLRQILLNLLSNAIKFTDEGKVRLNVTCAGGRINFTVSDTGIGMNSEQKLRLFTPFDQADSSTTRKYGGSGLGLTISHTLAHLMGGDITVESESGKGSTFTLSLPLSEAEPGFEHTTQQALITGFRLKGVRVLVAEDVELNRLVIQDMLEHEGAQVVFAKNGKQALDRLEELGVTAFDVVLMDVQMPVMDGYEATQLVLEIAPALPVIGLTAHAMVEERDKCVAAGMVEHIAKPINIDTLVDAILRQLNSYPAAEQGTSALTKQVVTSEVTAADETPPDFLPGLDMDEGLERLRGKWPSYKRLLLLFYKQYKTGADNMASLLARGELEEAGQLAHSLKGVSGTLGAGQLYDQATAMEDACRIGDREAANAQMALFRTRLEEVIDGLVLLAEN